MCEAEDAIERSQALLALQRQVIAAMEHDLAKLGDWRQFLLEELSVA
jgi:hypothetical protein